MKTIYHAAASRGHADHGWLNTYHTFSFANYHNPDRMGFGALRVLNDDTVQAGRGFGMHPHRNMEIVSIPLEGKLAHGDNMGNSGVIKKGQIQIMSAGTGITHTEMNGSNNEPIKFLQIWVIPKIGGVNPRYDEISISENEKPNHFQQIVSPHKSDEGSWIHQDAWFYLGNFEDGIATEYIVKNPNNGVYIFIIEGKAQVGDQILNRRDGLGITETGRFEINISKQAEILLMEVPMLR